jgi:hypothetical protein
MGNSKGFKMIERLADLKAILEIYKELYSYASCPAVKVMIDKTVKEIHSIHKEIDKLMEIKDNQLMN